jgi:hypothetical protein
MAVDLSWRTTIRRIATPIILTIAIVYFLIDALVLSLLRPVIEWFAALKPFAGLRRWVESLGPYPTLALFLVPIALFEPVKPVGLWLIGTRQFLAGTLVLVIGEILKIVIVERLFHIAQPKLMSIRAFAVTYTFIVGWIEWLQALPPWQWMMRLVRALKLRARLIGRSAWRRVTGAWRRLSALARGT